MKSGGLCSKAGQNDLVNRKGNVPVFDLFLEKSTSENTEYAG